MALAGALGEVAGILTFEGAVGNKFATELSTFAPPVASSASFMEFAASDGVCDSNAVSRMEAYVLCINIEYPFLN